MERVSTYNLHNITMGAALNVEAQLANAQLQEASGLTATDYSGLSGQQSYEVLNMENEYNQATTWAAEASTMESRSEAMYSAIGSMTSVVTKLESSISGALSSTDNSTLSTTAQSLMDQLVSAMNTQENGRYLFSGSNISTAPINMANYSSTSISASSYNPTTQDFSYYQGNDTVLTVQTDSSTTVSYGVCAGTTATTASATNPASAFEAAIRATEAVIKAGSLTTGSTSQTTLLKQAMTVAQSALTQLANLQESVSDIANQLTSASAAQTNYATLLQTSISNIKEVNTATVTTQIAQYQTQLQSSFYAVSTIGKLSLASYL